MKFKSPFPEIKAITKKYASSALVWKTTVYALALFGVIVLLLLFLLLNMLGGTGNIVPNVPKNTVFADLTGYIFLKSKFIRYTLLFLALLY